MTNNYALTVAAAVSISAVTVPALAVAHPFWHRHHRVVVVASPRPPVYAGPRCVVRHERFWNGLPGSFATLKGAGDKTATCLKRTGAAPTDLGAVPIHLANNGLARTSCL